MRYLIVIVSIMAIGERSMAIDRIWDGGAGTTSWHDAANWNPDGVPQPGDNVIISVPDTVIEVVITGATGAINSVSCDEHLRVSGGTLTIDQVSSIRQLTVTVGATVNGSGSVIVMQSMTWNTGTLQLSGALVIAEGGALTTQDVGTRTLNCRLDNYGNGLFRGRIRFAGADAVFNNYGILTVDSPTAEILISADVIGGSINNFGAFIKTGNSNVIFYTCCPFKFVAFNNHGYVEVQQGKLSVGGGDHTGDFHIADGVNTELEFATLGFPTNFSKSCSITGRLVRMKPQTSGGVGSPIVFNGDLNVDYATFTGNVSLLNGSAIVNQMITLGSGAHVNFAGPVTQLNILEIGSQSTTDCNAIFDTPDSYVNQCLFSNGELSGSGNVYILENFAWDGSITSPPTNRMTGTGRTIIEPGATMLANLINSRTLDRRLENYGSMTVRAGLSTQQFTVTGELINYGLLTFEHAISNQWIMTILGNGLVRNEGEMHKIGLGQTTFNMPFENTGTCFIDAGSMRLTGGGSNEGSLTIGSSTTLFLSVGLYHGPRSLIDGAGTLRIFGGTHLIDGQIALTGEIDISGTGSFTVTIQQSQHDLNIELHETLIVNAPQQWRTLFVDENGMLAGPGDVLITENLAWEGTMSGSGQTIVDQGASLLISHSPTLERTLVNRGTASWNSGTNTSMIFRSGDFINEGMLTVGASCSFKGEAGDNLFSNIGTFAKTGAGIVTISAALAPMLFNNDGQVNVNQGTLEVLTEGAGIGNVTIMPGATIALASDFATGSMEVAGSLRMSPSSTLMLSEAYSQLDTGYLRMAMNDSNTVPIFCKGNISLNGTLAALFSPPPAESTEVSLLSSTGVVSGSFETHGVSPAGSIQYTESEVIWTIFIAGDMNGDGLVGVPDLLFVINSWGACPAIPGACPADADVNGTVGVSDLLVVINGWG